MPANINLRVFDSLYACVLNAKLNMVTKKAPIAAQTEIPYKPKNATGKKPRMAAFAPNDAPAEIPSR